MSPDEESTPSSPAPQTGELLLFAGLSLYFLAIAIVLLNPKPQTIDPR